MLITALIPTIVAILGAFIYAFAASAKPAELGRLAFACGLLALCFAFATKVVHF
jgi:chromate transport protein ChrA